MLVVFAVGITSISIGICIRDMKRRIKKRRQKMSRTSASAASDKCISSTDKSSDNVSPPLNSAETAQPCDKFDHSEAAEDVSQEDPSPADLKDVDQADMIEFSYI